MAGIEYMPTNLPRYVTITPRTAVANSAVAPNHILLLSEDGMSVTAKQPDGSFKVISIDPSDTTATAADVASGKLFYNASGVLTTGTASGGSMDFYKCASVDTTNHTWTGYKAVFSSGVYSFESTATTGLTYTSVTPFVGDIYNSDALITVAYMYGMIPDLGLVFYAPLSSSAAIAETGQTLTEYGNPVFGVENGIPSVYLDGSSQYIDAYNSSNLPVGNADTTLSCWAKAEPTSLQYCYFFSYGGVGDTCRGFSWKNSDGSIRFGSGGYDYGDGEFDILTSWHHILWTHSSTYENCLYIDGNLIYTKNVRLNTQNTSLIGIGSWTHNSVAPHDWKSKGYFAAFRIYNRVLTASEIAALAAEFTPTQGA